MGKKSGGGGGYSTGGLEDATAESVALQKKIYEETTERAKPWYETGAAGASRLGSLMGLSGGEGEDNIEGREALYRELEPSFSEKGVVDYEGLNAAVEGMLGQQGVPTDYGSLMEGFGTGQFEADPGYQFRQEQGNKELGRAMAAQGVTLGGGGLGEVNPQVAQAMQDYSQGLASQEYGAAYDRYNMDQQNVFNRLMGVSGMGQSALGLTSNVASDYATNVGNLKTGLAGAQYQSAAARAAEPSGFSRALGTGMQVGGMAMMASDERLKENIELVGKEKGHNIYEFDYKNSAGRYRGVMAQEVMKINPGAVAKMIGGYLGVNYDKLGLKMELVSGV